MQYGKLPSSCGSINKNIKCVLKSIEWDIYYNKNNDWPKLLFMDAIYVWNDCCYILVDLFMNKWMIE